MKPTYTARLAAVAALSLLCAAQLAFARPQGASPRRSGATRETGPRERASRPFERDAPARLEIIRDTPGGDRGGGRHRGTPRIGRDRNPRDDRGWRAGMPRAYTIRDRSHYRQIGHVGPRYRFYDPFEWRHGYAYDRSNWHPRTSYRVYHCSSYRHRRYWVYPWYSTYYYPAYPSSPYAIYYAPGFSWGFQYGDDGDDEGVMFAYGYGSGIRFGDDEHVYSWYPYGGYQRLRCSDTAPYGDGSYVSSGAEYEIE